jgi:hypothetical protein
MDKNLLLQNSQKASTSQPAIGCCVPFPVFVVGAAPKQHHHARSNGTFKNHHQETSY